MKPFSYTAVHKRTEAFDALSNGGSALAGGTDLLPLLKIGVQSVNTVADIKTAGLPADIRVHDGGVSIGALATIRQIETSVVLQGRYPLLVQAARETATVQIRNRATLGGNLLQRPRCWYFRNPRARCWLKGGADCLAVEGRNEQHAVFGDSPCKAVHPSDLAGCLLALDVDVVLQSPRGERRLPLSEFFAPPEEGRRRETLIAADELLTCIHLPALPAGALCLYLKAMDRKVWAFALAGVAAVLYKPGEKIEDLRLVANALAPVPYRLTACEAALTGGAGKARDIEAAVAALGTNARPLSDNAWKLDLARRLLRRALEELLA